MLSAGLPMFLAIPGQARERELFPGRVLESDADGFVAEFDKPVELMAGAGVSAYCEVGGKFFQQGATVDAVRSTDPTSVIAFRRVGKPICAESRNSYRVCVIGSGMKADVGVFGNCDVVDISPDGMAVIVPGRLDAGQVVPITLTYENRRLSGVARLQAVKVLEDGTRRCGLLALDGTGSLRYGLEELTKSLQRAQLRRLARSACGY